MKTKKFGLLAAILVVCALIAGCLVACTDAVTPDNAPSTAQHVYGEYSYDLLKTFNAKYNGRKAGSAQEYAAAQFIMDELESFGYSVTFQPYNTKNGVSQNVIATKSGSDTSKQIIVGAHYDSSMAGYGIDDNASGVAAMLEAAKYYSTKTPSCNIVFVAFGAEEIGLVGSKYFVDSMSEDDIAKTKFMVNIDTIAAGDKMYAYGGEDETSKQLLSGILSFGKDLGLITQKGLNANYAEGLTGDWSDHSPFKKAGIPFIYFESTNWDIQEEDGTYTDGYVQIEDGNGGYAIMHTNKDKLDWIEQNFPGRVSKHMTVFSKCIIELIK